MKKAHIVLLNYPEKIDGWNISHELSKEIEAKKVNFYNYHKHKEDLQTNEENKLFPPRFTVWIQNPGLEHVCSKDLDANITITLYSYMTIKIIKTKYTLVSLKFMHLDFICLLRFCQAHQRMPLLYPTIIVMIIYLHVNN